MNNDLQFHNLEKTNETVSIYFDGNKYELSEGDNLAASLMAVGVRVLRNTSISGSPRGPFCMMGACYDCQVEIDGETRQACMTIVNKGMNIKRLNGVRTI